RPGTGRRCGSGAPRAHRENRRTRHSVEGELKASGRSSGASVRKGRMRGTLFGIGLSVGAGAEHRTESHGAGDARSASAVVRALVDSGTSPVRDLASGPTLRGAADFHGT